MIYVDRDVVRYKKSSSVSTSRNILLELRVGNEVSYYELEKGVKYFWKVDHGSVWVQGHHVTITIEPEYWPDRLKKQRKAYEADLVAQKDAHEAKEAVLTDKLLDLKRVFLSKERNQIPLVRTRVVTCPNWGDSENVSMFGGYLTTEKDTGVLQFINVRQVRECQYAEAYKKVLMTRPWRCSSLCRGERTRRAAAADIDHTLVKAEEMEVKSKEEIAASDIGSRETTVHVDGEIAITDGTWQRPQVTAIAGKSRVCTTSCSLRTPSGNTRTAGRAQNRIDRSWQKAESA